MTESMPICKQCEGAPNLSIDFDNLRVNQIFKKSVPQRPQSAKFNKGHAIVQKDFYRGMKSDTIVKKHLEKKKASEMGRAPKQTLLELKNQQYKTAGEVISDVYARSVIPESRLYLIDKIVRMRGQHGRFGIDHSELLNYELEQTNQARDDHMNWLVYKDEAMTEEKLTERQQTVSELLFNRLKAKEDEKYSDYSARKMMGDIVSDKESCNKST